MNRLAKRVIAALLAATFLGTNAVLADAHQLNVWEERRQNVARITSIPQPRLSQSSLIESLPPVGRINQATRPPSVNSSRLDLITASVPTDLATVQEVNPGSKNDQSPVVVVQDIHLNSEAQANIAGLLKRWINSGAVGAIGVEGAFSMFAFSPGGTVKASEVGQLYLKSNRIAAPAAAALMATATLPNIEGVDNEALYDANVRAYLQGAELQTPADDWIRKERKQLAKQAASDYSVDMKAVAGLFEARLAEKISLGEYIRALSRRTSSLTPDVKTFLEAFALEQSLDFSGAERERNAVIRLLAERLSEHNVASFLKETIDFRAGRIGFAAYYRQVVDLCESKSISLKKFPMFSAYLRYVVAADAVRPRALLSDIEAMEEAVVRHTAKTPEELQTALRSRWLDRVQKLVSFSLTPSEWKAYQREAREPPDILRPFEDFYRFADERSATMIERTLTIRSRGPRVLVTGGFHSDEIGDLLNRRGVPYMLVSPRLTKVDDLRGNAYLSLFNREKGPLEKLFTGRKLFLNPASVSAAGFRRYGSRFPEVRRQLQRADETTNQLAIDAGLPAASIADRAFKETGFDQRRPVLYALYTIFVVNWEMIFQLSIPLALHLFGFNPWLAGFMLAASAAVFAWVHPDRTRSRLTSLFLVGLALGLPLVFPSLGFWNAVIISGLTHSVYNAFKLADLLPKWMAMASVITMAQRRRQRKKPQAVAPQPPETDETRAQLDRMSEESLDDLFFRYGRLSDDHPIYQRVSTLMRKGLKDEAKNYRLEILPHWNEVNAMALPNGTIVIGAGLLKFVEYEEELQAVLAHEAMHIKRRHSELREKLRQVFTDTNLEAVPNLLLRMAGLSRAQEYEADLRWIFEEMKKKGINPYGQVVFMERFQAYEEARGRLGKDVSHGGWSDRTLNSESLFFHLPIDTLSHDLTPLSPFEAELRPFLGQSPGMTLIAEPLFVSDDDELERETAERVKIAEEIPVAHISRAIHALYPQTKSKDQKTRLAARKVLTELVDRVSTDIFTDTVWTDDDVWPMARALYYELHAGIPFLFPDEPHKSKALERDRDSDESAFSKLEDFERLPDILRLPEVQNLFSPVFKARYSGLNTRLFARYLDRIGWKTKPSAKMAERIVKFASNWTAALDEMCATKGTWRPDRAHAFWEIIGQARGLLDEPQESFNLDLDRIAEATGIPKTATTSRPARFRPVAIEQAEAIGRRLFETLESRRPFNSDRYDDVFEEIRSLVGKASVRQVMDFFGAVSQGAWRPYNEASLRFGALSNADQEYELESSDPTGRIQVKSRLARHTVLRLWERAMAEFPQFKDLDSLTATSLQYYALGYLAYSQGFEGGESENLFLDDSTGQLILREKANPTDASWGSFFSHNETDADNPEKVREDQLPPADRRHLNLTYLKVIEDKWLVRGHSRSDIAQLYQMFEKGNLGPIVGTLKPIEVFQDLFEVILSTYLGRFSTWSEFFGELKALEDLGVPVSSMIIENKEAFGWPLQRLWSNLPKDPSNRELELINEAVLFVQDPLLKQSLQSFFYERMWEKLTFDKKLDVLFQRTDKGVFDFQRFNDFVEKEVRSEEHHRKVLERVNERLDVFMSKSAWEAGVAALLSNLEMSKPEDVQDFMLALLESKQSDRKLKLFLYKHVTGYAGFLGSFAHEDADDTSVGNVNDRLRMAAWIEESLYSMGPLARIVLLRRLMAGKAGLISQPKQRLRFLKTLIDSAVTSGGDEPLMKTIDETAAALGKAERWKPLYFAMQSFLQERVANPSQTPSSWSEAVWSKSEPDKGVDDLPRRSYNQLKPAYEVNCAKPWLHGRYFGEFSRETLRNTLEERGVVTPAVTSAKVDALTFLIELAESMGALGVRFLQVLPQFVDLDPAYLQRFSRVYDAVEGQSKLSALAVMTDKWPHFWEDVEFVEERLGGGSLMTVYRIHMKDRCYHPQFNGKMLAIKVVNPNLRFHLEAHMKLAREALDDLIKMHGKKYETAKMVLEEVREWIERDASFTRFVEKDREFKSANEGFTVDGVNYEIAVPTSFEIPLPEGEERDPDQPQMLIVEEYVKGEKLTQNWEALAAKGHDLKGMVSVMVRNYLHQVRTGRLHSDVHIGNFLIVPANKQGDKHKIVILDRNFFLDLTPDVKAAVQPLADLLDLVSRPSEEFVDELIAASKAKVSEEDRKAIIAAWDRNRSAVAKGSWSFDRVDDLRLIAKLVPEAGDLVEFLINPANVVALPSDKFIDRMNELSGKKMKGPLRKQLIAEWTKAKEDLFERQDWTGIQKFLSALPDRLQLPDNVANVLRPLVSLVNAATETPEAFVDRLLKISPVQNVGKTQRATLVNAWKKTTQRLRNGEWKAIGDFLVSVRSSGIELPLEVTLILKNFNALQQMSVNAGFNNGLIGAVAYQGAVPSRAGPTQQATRSRASPKKETKAKPSEKRTSTGRKKPAPPPSTDKTSKTSKKKGKQGDKPGTASILDEYFRASYFHEDHPILYGIYTIILVNWEMVFQLVIPLAQNVFGFDPWLAGGMLALSAALFAAAHPNRTRSRFISLILVGLVLGLPFVITGFGFWNAVVVSGLTHSVYNALKLAGFLPKWMAMASVLEAQRLTPGSNELRAALLKAASQTELHLDVENLLPSDRTGAALGDLVEVAGRRLEKRSDAAANYRDLRALSSALRHRLTGGRDPRVSYAGPSRGIFREMAAGGRAGQLNDDRVIFQMLPSDPMEAASVARETLRELSGRGIKARVAFISDAEPAAARLRDIIQVPSGVIANFFGPKTMPRLSAAVAAGFLSAEEFRRVPFVFLASKSSIKELDAFIDVPDLSPERFRIYLTLTDTMNPLALEVTRESLRRLDDLTKTIAHVLIQA